MHAIKNFMKGTNIEIQNYFQKNIKFFMIAFTVHDLRPVSFFILMTASQKNGYPKNYSNSFNVSEGSKN